MVVYLMKLPLVSCVRREICYRLAGQNGLAATFSAKITHFFCVRKNTLNANCEQCAFDGIM